jgi:23S rRNA pseudouridine2605 synthase
MTRKPEKKAANAGERIAKVMARAGLCSRRDAEIWIGAGRVSVNGQLLASPAYNVKPGDRVEVDGKPLPVRERTRLFRYHKPRGLMTTDRDPQGRPTLFQRLPKGLPRLFSVGRLDMTSEGLLLLTNDGGLKRALELPETGWLRRYRVRANGRATQEDLDRLKKGVTVDGVSYGPVEATLDRVQGANLWLTVGIREGKNREIRKVLGSLGLTVSRLIRVSYGPFQLLELAPGAIEEVNTRIMRDQVSEQIARKAGVDFDAPLREVEAPPTPVKVAEAGRPKKRPSNREPAPAPARARPAPTPIRARPAPDPAPRPPSRDRLRSKRGRSPSGRGGGPRGSHHGTKKK